MLIKNSDFSIEFQSNKNNSSHWYGILDVDKHKINVYFETNIFPDLEIDWDKVHFICEKIITNSKTIIKTSENLFIAIHKEIFQNEYEEKEGYFNFSEIEITQLLNTHQKCIDFEFKLTAYIFSKSNHIMDPYADYIAEFKHYLNQISIVSVQRLI